MNSCSCFSRQQWRCTKCYQTSPGAITGFLLSGPQQQKVAFSAACTSEGVIDSREPLDFDTRVGAYCVVTDNGKILLTRIREGWSGTDGGWTLPGGGMEPNETPEETARREVLEETGLEVEPGELLAIDSFTVQPGERLDPADRGRALLSLRLIYAARVTGGVLTSEPEDSTDRAEWILLEDARSIRRVELVDVALEVLRTAPATVPAADPS